MVSVVIGLGRLTAPGRRQSSLIALCLAAVVALAGAVLWGLVALLLHRQLSLLGLLIGGGAGAAVARYRPAHRLTVAAGAVIAVAGCALGTFLAVVFSLLKAEVSLSTIAGHLSFIVRSYPSEVGVLGVLFWLIAVVAAVWVPMRARRPADPSQT